MLACDNCSRVQASMEGTSIRRYQMVLDAIETDTAKQHFGLPFELCDRCFATIRDSAERMNGPEICTMLRNQTVPIGDPIGPGPMPEGDGDVDDN